MELADLLDMFDDDFPVGGDFNGLPPIDDFESTIPTSHTSPVPHDTPVTPKSKADAFWSDRSMTKADGSPVQPLPGMSSEQVTSAKKMMKSGSFGISDLRAIVGEVDGISTYDLNGAAELFVPHRLRVAPPADILEDARKEYLEKLASMKKQQIAQGDLLDE